MDAYEIHMSKIMTSKNDIVCFVTWLLHTQILLTSYLNFTPQISGDKIIFSVFDGSKVPISVIENDELKGMINWAKTKVKIG